MSEYDWGGPAEWEDARPDYDVWEENQVAQDERLEREAEKGTEADVRRVIGEELRDDIENVRGSLEHVISFLYKDNNPVKAYKYACQALDYLRHVEENAGRLS